MADTIEWSEPEPPRKGRRSAGAIIVALMTSLLAVGLGYAAWQQWQARESAVAALTNTRTQLQALTQEHKRSQQSLADAQQHGTDQQHHIEQDALDLDDLKTKLGATEARLE